MIESKILGSAAGIQRQDVIDKSESDRFTITYQWCNDGSVLSAVAWTSRLK